MNLDQEPQKLRLNSFRQKRLLGLLIISISVLLIIVRQQLAFVWDVSLQVLGPFITYAFLIFPYILLILGFFLYLQTESTGSKFEEKAYQQAQVRHAEEPDKAKPVWDMAQLTLESYFRRNLSQIQWIFWLSIVVMTLGFLLILYGVALSYQNPRENWIVGAIGGIAGIMTEFIGATFLYVYRSSIEQAGKYAEILERMNIVGMSMQILDSVADPNSDPDAIAEDSPDNRLLQAKIEMAKALLDKL